MLSYGSLRSRMIERTAKSPKATPAQEEHVRQDRDGDDVERQTDREIRIVERLDLRQGEREGEGRDHQRTV